MIGTSVKLSHKTFKDQNGMVITETIDDEITSITVISNKHPDFKMEELVE